MPPRKSVPEVKAERSRTEKEKPFDPEVEFGKGVKIGGISSHPHSKKIGRHVQAFEVPL